MSNESSIDRFGACETLSIDKFTFATDGFVVSSMVVSDAIVTGMVTVVVSANEVEVEGSSEDDGIVWTLGFWEVVLSNGAVCLSKRADFSLV